MAGAPGQGPGLVEMLPLAVITLFIFYFIVFRPEARKQKTLTTLERGDRVVMKSGVYGTVVGIDGDCIQLRVADQVKIEISLQAVDRLVSKAKESKD
jgi:preprotein translocase subunit YajC